MRCDGLMLYNDVMDKWFVTRCDGLMFCNDVMDSCFVT